MQQIILYLLTIPAVLLTLIVHEVSHGLTADRLGDPTARSMGRLSLNPFRHLDPFGTVCMVLFRFGWARPVPIDPRYFRNPKRDMALTALAGPVSNLLLAFFSVPCYLLLGKLYSSLAIAGTVNNFVLNLVAYTWIFFVLLNQVNIGLAVFNLIPLPPLDGSRVLYAFLPSRYYFGMMRYEKYISIALMLFLLFGNRLGILDPVMNALSGGMQSLWKLLPAFR